MKIQRLRGAQNHPEVTTGLAHVEDWGGTARYRFVVLERVVLEGAVVDGDGKVGGTIGADGWLRADDAAAADEAAGARQRDDDGDLVGHRRRIVALDHRAGGRDNEADARAPFGIAARAKPNAGVQFKLP
jgi:hypothetical protein